MESLLEAKPKYMTDYIRKGDCSFKSDLILEGSWGQRSVGNHKSTMIFYMVRDTNRGFIEWDIPALDRCEEIGLWFDADGNLEDYDGLMGFLPKEAIELIEKSGYKVDRSEFNPDLVEGDDAVNG